MTLTPLPPLRDVLKEYGIEPKKWLGQNFLLDKNINDKITRAAGTVKNKTVLEIGPGPGGLTRSLLSAGAKSIVLIEKDKRFIPLLNEMSQAFPGKLKILHGDATELDPTPFLTGEIKVIANLPYNVSTVLLNKWLDQDLHALNWKSLTLMFQYEVAKRITAKAASRESSRISLKAELFTNAKIAFQVAPECFTPKPKVNSAIVHFEVLQKPRHQRREPQFSQITREAFGQRRKMLRSSLKKLGGQSLIERLQKCGISPSQRPENISLEQFCRLSFEINSV